MAEQMSLCHFAGIALQEILLCLRLYAFGDNFQTKAVGNAYDRLAEFPGTRILGYPGYKGSVDFYRLDRQAVQPVYE